MLLEVALALLVTVLFWSVILKTTALISKRYRDLKMYIKAIDYAGNCCEQLRLHSNLQAALVKFECKLIKIKLNDIGKWNISFSDRERKRLCDAMECCYLEVSWNGCDDSKRSHILFSGVCKSEDG